MVRDWQEMDDGTMFTDQDVRAANKVCVIGRTIANELFDGESPVGQMIRVKNVAMRVVGVLGTQGRQYDGHGSGRYRYGALDHDQVSGFGQ